MRSAREGRGSARRVFTYDEEFAFVQVVKGSVATRIGASGDHAPPRHFELESPNQPAAEIGGEMNNGIEWGARLRDM